MFLLDARRCLPVLSRNGADGKAFRKILLDCELSGMGSRVLLNGLHRKKTLVSWSISLMKQNIGYGWNLATSSLGQMDGPAAL